MKYVAVYRQTVATLVCVEANSKEEAAEKMQDAVVNQGRVALSMNDWVDCDDEIVFIDNPTKAEIDAAIDCG